MLEAFYEQLNEEVRATPKMERVRMLGEFNAGIVSVLGHGLGFQAPEAENRGGPHFVIS